MPKGVGWISRRCNNKRPTQDFQTHSVTFQHDAGVSRHRAWAVLLQSSYLKNLTNRTRRTSMLTLKASFARALIGVALAGSLAACVVQPTRQVDVVQEAPARPDPHMEEIGRAHV